MFSQIKTNFILFFKEPYVTNLQTYKLQITNATTVIKSETKEPYVTNLTVETFKCSKNPYNITPITPIDHPGPEKTRTFGEFFLFWPIIN